MGECASIAESRADVKRTTRIGVGGPTAAKGACEVGVQDKVGGC